MIKNLLKRIGIGLSPEEKNKRRLKAMLEEMLKLTKKRDLKGVKEIHQSFQHLIKDVFGKLEGGRKITQEEMNYDLARNNIINSFSGGFSEEQRQERLEEAQQYIDLL